LKSKKWRVGAILLAVVIVTGAVAGVSFAGSGQSSSAVSDLYQSFVSKLAANLGVDQSTLTAALDTTKKQMLDEAVQQGKITQEQADRISSCENGCFGGFGFLNGKFKGHGNFKGKGLQQQGNFNGEGLKGQGFPGMGRNLNGMADVLGMTADELKAEMQSGKKIDEIAAGRGITAEQLRQKMLELKKDEISRAVADGKMTQEQADKVLQKLEKRFK